MFFSKPLFSGLASFCASNRTSFIPRTALTLVSTVTLAVLQTAVASESEAPFVPVRNFPATYEPDEEISPAETLDDAEDAVSQAIKPALSPIGNSNRTVQAERADTLFREADDVAPLRLTVPSRRPSRIDFPDEKILSVVADTSHVEVRGEADRSDFFLLPKFSGSTTLFVTLARGETVPVELTVDDGATPRNVVLRLRDRGTRPETPRRSDLPAMKSLPYADLFTTILKDLENGRPSRGLMPVARGADAPLTPAARRTLEGLKPLAVTTDAVWQTRELTITRFIVRNGRLVEAVIDERALLSDGVLAFAAEKPALHPAERMRFYVFEAK